MAIRWDGGIILTQRVHIGDILCMTLFPDGQRDAAEALADLAYCNPFLPRRLELERRVLGNAADEDEERNDPLHTAWHSRGEPLRERAGLKLVEARVAELVEPAREALATGAAASDAQRVLYEDLALYLLYESVRSQLFQTVQQSLAHEAAAAQQGDDPAPSPAAGPLAYYRPFAREFDRLLRPGGRSLPSDHDPAHVFACFFQIRRAFVLTFHHIVGPGPAAASLRAAVWQSVFTHDLRRYYRGRYRVMGDMATLITGESGTGKELVARAIGRSRYIPFDPETRRFAEDFAASFFPLNLSAMSPTLIESELFGHARGAYTGAVAERRGWLELCPPLGCVFLDEIGELDGAIQVKLLRVLQERRFTRLGESRERPFRGKIIAATHRDLPAEMASGRFRPDLYYRLCGDVVTTPTLREQLAAGDAATTLHQFAAFLARRVAGDVEADVLAAEVTRWIDRQMRGYAWPGNVRELEQCVRNVMIRGRYDPPVAASAGEEDAWPLADLAASMRAGEATADQVLGRYCRWMVRREGGYEAASRRLSLDRRTVKRRAQAAGGDGGV